MQELLKKDLLIYDSALPTKQIYALWEDMAREGNLGAVCIFSGIVREERIEEAQDSISALSFDIYMPILKSWFDTWSKRAESSKAKILMAHSRGDVRVGESSFMCGILSKNRAAALSLYDRFIEDFKANAPIWKYDIVGGNRIYAKDRSKMLSGAGILANTLEGK